MKNWTIPVIAALCVFGLAGCAKNDASAPAGQAPAAAGAAPATSPAAGGSPGAAPGTAPVAGTTPIAVPVPPPPPAPKEWTIPAGTVIAVRTLDGMSTKNAKSGNEFDATLSEPLVAEGHTLANTGASVVGRVVN